MTVNKRGNSFYIDFGFEGKRIRKKSPENTFKGAQAYELLLRQKLARGKLLNEESAIIRYKFEDFAILWLDTYVRNNNKPSEHLIKKYILNSILIPFFGKKFIDEIKQYEIEEFKNHLLEERKVSRKTVNNYLSILSRCLKSANEWSLIENTPRIKLLKVPPQKYNYLTEAETEILLDKAEGIWYEMILLAVRTGLRFGELIALKWEDIDLETGIMNVNRNLVRGFVGSPKNNRSRIVPLTQNVLTMLKRKKISGGYIFQNRKGKPMIYNSSRKKLKALCVKADIKEISWHALRHSFATHLIRKNVSVVTVKELLGHSDIKMTLRYSHLNLPVLKSAVDSLEPQLKINGTISSQITNSNEICANISSKICRGAGN